MCTLAAKESLSSSSTKTIELDHMESLGCLQDTDSINRLEHAGSSHLEEHLQEDVRLSIEDESETKMFESDRDRTKSEAENADTSSFEHCREEPEDAIEIRAHCMDLQSAYLACAKNGKEPQFTNFTERYVTISIVTYLRNDLP